MVIAAEQVESFGEPVKFELLDAVAWIRMNRPQTMNAIDTDLLDSLERALTEVEGNPYIRAAVITGTGKAFCAVGDLSRLLGEGSPDPESLRTFARRATDVIRPFTMDAGAG